MNLGCGPNAAAGWLNCDVAGVRGSNVRVDVRRGIPFAPGTFDCIAAIHVLQDLAWQEIGPALEELNRVLKAHGVLRLAVPDLEKSIHAYLAGDVGYFYVPDADARSLGAKLVTQLTWYGSVRTPCNLQFLEEWLYDAGFAEVAQQAFGESRIAGLASLDNRERESLFVEAVKAS